MRQSVDITIVGAGVIGLAVAAEVSDGRRTVYVLEKNDSFGQETSSRNSQVVHSGIYYPDGSLKARLCVEGNARLYPLCERQGIRCRRIGKLVVAVDQVEVAQLEMLLHQGSHNGVEGLRLLNGNETMAMEPAVKAVASLLVPSTGVLDAYGLMRYFLAKARDNGAGLACRSEVVGVEKLNGQYRVTVKDGQSTFAFDSRVVVNCAGLYSDRVASLSGIDVDMAGYRLRYVKGEYFRVVGEVSKSVGRLIYPVPVTDGAGLGIHVTLDLEGRMLLGPSAQSVEELDYSVEPPHRQLFYESVVRYLPGLELHSLEPEMAGIRPTLLRQEGAFADFVIRDESDRGLPGLVNLIGIESPGLTCSPAIGSCVARIVDAALGD